MIRALSNYFGQVSPVFIDGFLYMLIAVFGAIQGYLSLDDAAKWVNPQILFWMKGVAIVCLTSVTSIKMFRSTSFAEYQRKKNGGNTTTFVKPP